MSVPDLETLLAEISPDNPCGDDLEYEAVADLERLAESKPEQQIGDTFVAAEAPDWGAVRRAAVAAFPRTKDLRVACGGFARSLLNTDGYEGIALALQVIAGLVDRYWEPVHPRLDPDDGNDPTMRVNKLMELCDPQTVLNPLRGAPLVSSRMLGRFGLREIAIANGDLPPPPDTEPPTKSTIEGAFLEADLVSLQAKAHAIQAALDATRRIEELVGARIGVSEGPNFETLRAVLNEAHRVLRDWIARRSPASDESRATGAQESGSGELTAAGGNSGDIRSRDDVTRMLDKLCDYYAKHEPASPVPVLLRRAKKLVTLDFFDIVKNLIPAGMPELQVLRGPTDEGEL